MNYDIIIVGGGLVGASFIAKILQSNLDLKLALIDNTAPKTALDMDFNSRAIALSHGSVVCLQSLGVFTALASYVENIKEVHVSAKGHFGSSRITAADAGLDALGAVVNADVLNHVLNKHIENKLTIFRPVNIVKMTQHEKGWALHLSSGEMINTKLLVAADGTQSFVRQTLGIETKCHDYHQSAITVNIELAQSHQNVAYERFTPDGAIAMLPFGEHRVKCVWVMSDLSVDVLLQKDDAEFIKEIQNVFGFRLGRLQSLGKRITYPLKSLQAHALYAHRCVLLGNAANTFHPIAAQGFNLGLRDAVVLSKLLIESYAKGEDLGENTILKKYSDARHIDHQRTKYFTDNLAESPISPSLGVLACEFLPFTKKWVMNQGLGSQTVIIK